MRWSRAGGTRRIHRICAIALAALALACGDPAPASRAAEPPPPDLVLIVVDTLRADRVGAYGAPRPTTPVLDRIAAEGTRFAYAFAPSSWTRPSVGSLFTSRRPSEHGAVRADLPLRDGIPTLAELLRAAGYRTVGVSANFVHVTRATGMARGFDAWSASSRSAGDDPTDVLWQRVDPQGRAVSRRAPRADEVNREVLRLLPARDTRPLFLFVHYMEPHSPYAPPERTRRAFAREASRDRPTGVGDERLLALASGEASLEPGEREWLLDLYDAEVAAVDAAIGALLTDLAARGFGDAVVAITSDHGEEFGEHDGWFHARTLHAESLRIPLILRGPGVPRDAVVEAPADLLDVPTTLLGLARVAPADAMRGRALLGRASGGRELVAELHADPRIEARVGARRHRIAVSHGPWKAVSLRDGTRRAYRIDRDPGEREPLPIEAAPAALLAQLDRAAAAHSGDAAPARSLAADELEALRALGYAR